MNEPTSNPRFRLASRAAICIAIIGSMIGIPAGAQVPFTLLHSFSNSKSDGFFPYAAVTLDEAGNLYGTTFSGGVTNAGVVFSIRSDGTGFKVLHSFGSGLSDDGSNVLDGLILGDDGYLYGVTASGGTGNGPDCPCGTIYKIKIDGGGYTILHSFAGSPGDGGVPRGILAFEPPGTLYGTTLQGGEFGLGTVFRLRTDGSGFELLRSFSGPPEDGQAPMAGVVLGADGFVYGTTPSGGANASFNDCTFNCGTIYRMKTDGASFTVLHTFSASSNDGVAPSTQLVLDRNGNIFGSAEGGLYDFGVIFTLKSDGTGFTLLHSFLGAPTDGKNPNAVVLGNRGRIYGSTYGGGVNDAGTIYSLSTSGEDLAVLHSFSLSPNDGRYPIGGVTVDEQENLYGTTHAGGDSSCPYGFSFYRHDDFCGTVFKMTLPSRGNFSAVPLRGLAQGAGVTGR